MWFTLKQNANLVLYRVRCSQFRLKPNLGKNHSSLFMFIIYGL